MVWGTGPASLLVDVHTVFNMTTSPSFLEEYRGMPQRGYRGRGDTAVEDERSVENDCHNGLDSTLEATIHLWRFGMV